MADSQSETQQSQPSHQGVCPFCKEEIKADAVRCSHCGANVGPSGWRMLPRGRRPVRCLPRTRTSSDRVDAPDVPPEPGESELRMANASGTCPDCNDLEIDDIGIWVLVECSPNQCVYELTAASRSMFDDDWRLRV